MQFLREISEFLTGLGPAVFLPIVLTIIGLIFGLKIQKAIISGLTFGVAFVGLNLVVEYFIGELTDPVEQIASRLGVDNNILDVGWGVGAAIAYGTNIGTIIIPISFATNFILLLFNWTKTLNIDIWNFWNYAFTGSVVYIASGNIFIGIIAVIIHTVITLLFADTTAKRVEKEHEIPGISISHPFAVTTIPIIYIVNAILNRIPYIKNINWQIKDSSKGSKWFILSNPLILGVLLGIFLGLLAGYYNDIGALLNLGITVGAVMVLIPKVVSIFMEALSPIAEAAQSFMQKYFKNREIFIGMDSALLLGHPSTIAAAVILIPIVLIISVILPFNRVLPLADLASIAYFVALVPMFTNGNLFRSIICGIVIMSVVLLILTGFGGTITQMANNVGYDVPGGGTDITALSSGNWISYILFKIGEFFGGVFN